MLRFWNASMFYILFSFVCVTSYERNYSSYKLFELDGPQKDIQEVIHFVTKIDALTAYEIRANRAQILLRPNILREFASIVNNTRLGVVELVSDFSLLLKIEKKQAVRNEKFSWDAYYDVDNINEYLVNMSRIFPDWTKLIVGGRSYENRDILGLKILTKVNLPKNKVKPIIFIESGIHAREWIVPATTTYLINKLLTSKDPNLMTLRDSFEWQIFPLVNPDGYHYSFTVDRMWRKTRSKSKNSKCVGVDANRNWGYHFGEHGASKDPCDYQLYAGSHPFSEIETRSLARYIAQQKNILAYISYHSFAWCILVPYSDSTEHSVNYTNLIKMAKKAAAFAHAYGTHHRYNCGTAAEIMHAISGASIDWVAMAVKPPMVFTFELRGRSFLWPANKIDELGEEVIIMLIGLFKEAKRLGYYTSA